MACGDTVIIHLPNDFNGQLNVKGSGVKACLSQDMGARCTAHCDIKKMYFIGEAACDRKEGHEVLVETISTRAQIAFAFRHVTSS